MGHNAQGVRIGAVVSILHTSGLSDCCDVLYRDVDVHDSWPEVRYAAVGNRTKHSSEPEQRPPAYNAPTGETPRVGVKQTLTVLQPNMPRLLFTS